jgi:hypothetical protein
MFVSLHSECFEESVERKKEEKKPNVKMPVRGGQDIRMY